MQQQFPCRTARRFFAAPIIGRRRNQAARCRCLGHRVAQCSRAAAQLFVEMLTVKPVELAIQTSIRSISATGTPQRAPDADPADRRRDADHAIDETSAR